MAAELEEMTQMFNRRFGKGNAVTDVYNKSTLGKGLIIIFVIFVILSVVFLILLLTTSHKTLFGWLFGSSAVISLSVLIWLFKIK